MKIIYFKILIKKNEMTEPGTIYKEKYGTT